MNGPQILQDIGGILRAEFFTRQIEHLAANHPGRARADGQMPATRRCGLGGITFRQNLEGQGQQGIARQDRQGLSELLMASRLTSTQVVVGPRNWPTAPVSN